MWRKVVLRKTVSLLAESTSIQRDKFDPFIALSFAQANSARACSGCLPLIA